MFGYIIINKPELKFREFDIYHSYYCGFCQTLKNEYGSVSQLSLSYDMTFLIMLLTSLYEPEDKILSCRCIAHPLEKHCCRTNDYTKYCSDMNLLLTYYKCIDDWQDEHKVTRLLYSKALISKIKQIEQAYPQKSDLLRNRMKAISEYESSSNTNLDKIAGLFGDIMAEVFAMKTDEWEPVLRHMGFYFGKFIYIMDAYDDIEKDIKSGNYNPLKPQWEHQPSDFASYCHSILTMMMSECCKYFELLPLIQDASILRNILYSGVWTRYELVTAKRNRKEDV